MRDGIVKKKKRKKMNPNRAWGRRNKKKQTNKDR